MIQPKEERAGHTRNTKEALQVVNVCEAWVTRAEPPGGFGSIRGQATICNAGALWLKSTCGLY